MRIAFFAKTKRRTRTTVYIEAALERAGHRVLRVNERKRRRWFGESLARRFVLATLARFDPELVLVHASDIALPTLAQVSPRYRTALFTPDCWKSPMRGPGIERACSVDLVLTVAEGQIQEFEEAGVKRAAYLAESCEPSAHFQLDEVADEWIADVAFIGKRPAASIYDARTDFIREVDEHFDLKIYGNGWEEMGIVPARAGVGPDGYRRVCSGAKIVLGRDWNTDVRWYFSNRTWFTLGCGGFLLTNYVLGLEDIFENHGQLVWYRSTDECLELIRHYLDRPDERRRISEAGHAYVLAHRTFDHWVRDLENILDGEASAFPPSSMDRLVSGT